MGKIAECPVKRFKGTVTLRDPMTFQMVARWEEALQVLRAAPKDDAGRYAEIEQTLYPLVIEMVEEWNLSNISDGKMTAENFPNAKAGTSAASIHSLIAWLINECQNVYNGNEDGDPNE